MGKNIRKIRLVAYGGIMIVLGLIFGYVESLFEIVIAGIGLKVGISNIVTLVSIFTLGPYGAFLVVLSRVILQAFLFGGFQSFPFSLIGFLFSYIAMNIAIYILTKNKVVENKAFLYAVSIIGGIMHNIGQLTMAFILIKTSRVFFLIPIYILAGTIAGLIVGVVAKLLLEKLPILWYNKN